MANRTNHTLYVTREWHTNDGDVQTGEVELKIGYTYYPGTDDTYLEPGDPEEFETIKIREKDSKGEWVPVNYYGSDTFPTGQRVIDEYDDWAMDTLTDEMRKEAIKK